MRIALHVAVRHRPDRAGDHQRDGGRRPDRELARRAEQRIAEPAEQIAVDADLRRQAGEPRIGERNRDRVGRKRDAGDDVAAATNWRGIPRASGRAAGTSPIFADACAARSCAGPREIARPGCLNIGISAIIAQATGGEPSMSEAAKHLAIEALRDGRRIEIRALRPEDRDGMLAAFRRASAQSLHRRFFSARSDFTDKEIAFFLNVDFVVHVALVAVAKEDGESGIVGGGRYFVVEPGQAEIAFAVIDQYQGQGIGAALMRHLVALAREAGLKELIAEVLPENVPMLQVLKKSGLPMMIKPVAEVVHVTLQLF